jgi:hypothetical protein
MSMEKQLKDKFRNKKYAYNNTMKRIFNENNSPRKRKDKLCEISANLPSSYDSHYKMSNKPMKLNK